MPIMGFQILLLFLCGTTTIFAAKLKMSSCPAGKGIPKNNSITVTSAEVVGCEAEPCIFYRGNTYSIKFKLIPDFKVTSRTRLDIVGTALTPVGPVELVKDNMCKRYVTLDCNALMQDTEMETEVTEPIHNYYPEYDGELRVIIKKNDEPIFCSQITIAIKEKSFDGAVNRAPQAATGGSMQDKMNDGLKASTGGFGLPVG